MLHKLFANARIFSAAAFDETNILDKNVCIYGQTLSQVFMPLAQTLLLLAFAFVPSSPKILNLHQQP